MYPSNEPTHSTTRTHVSDMTPPMADRPEVRKLTTEKSTSCRSTNKMSRRCQHDGGALLSATRESRCVRTPNQDPLSIMMPAMEPSTIVNSCSRAMLASACTTNGSVVVVLVVGVGMRLLSTGTELPNKHVLPEGHGEHNVAPSKELGTDEPAVQYEHVD